VSLIKNNINYPVIVMSMENKEFVKQLKPYEKDFVFATGSYADSAVLEFYLQRPVIVIGMGSKHARHHDVMSDFREYDGKNILIVRKRAPDVYNKFFNNVIIEEYVIKDAVFYFVKGYGFQYEKYKEEVLAGIKEQYYNIPPYLKMRENEKDFLGKYFR